MTESIADIEARLEVADKRLQEYRSDFFGKEKETFKVALAERAREYDLYWRRATYGWLFWSPYSLVILRLQVKAV